VIHQSKGIALTKKDAYQDFQNKDLFGRKSGESVKEKICKIGAAGYGGDKSPKLFS